MKTNYLLIIFICFSQMLTAQSMKIYKTDQSTVSFNMTDIDSIKFSTSANGNLVSSSEWICFTNNSLQSVIETSQGIYEKVDEGIKVYGGINSLIQLMPTSINSLMSKTIYLKWKVNGISINVGVELFSDFENLTSAGKVLSLSTKQAANNITNDTWYFTRISVASGNIISVTSLCNYDNNGGDVISSASLTANKDIKTFSFQTSADNSSYSILAESRIE